MAEIEGSILQRHCLGQRVADRAAWEQAVQAWAATRNTTLSRIDWQVTASDARTNLRRLCPAYDECQTTRTPSTPPAHRWVDTSACDLYTADISGHTSHSTRQRAAQRGSLEHTYVVS
jgi:hypothetical protein